MEKILVVVDCQNDFITGSLRNEEAIKAVPNIVKKIRSFNNGTIYATMDTHSTDYLNTNEGKKLPVEHCIQGTKGWEIEDNIKAALDDAKLRGIKVTYINKPTFGSSTLRDFIVADAKYYENYFSANEKYDIEFIGFCTDICVVSNVLMVKAELYETANITVDASCCAGVTPESHNAALLTMKMCQINVINE